MKKYLGLVLIAIFAGTIGINKVIPPVSAIILRPEMPKQIFSDIDEFTPDQEAIQSLKNSGIIQGYPDGTYKPEREMNRAEFVKVLIGSITKDPQGKNCFDDVREEWFAPYICEAKRRGIVEGTGSNKKFFNPADQIKFSEAAKVVAKTFELPVVTSTDANGEFWYKGYINSLAKAKAIPLSIEFFDANVNRGAMAESIWRLKEKVSDKASRTFDEISGEGLIAAQSCADIQNRLVKIDNYSRDGIMKEMSTSGIVAPQDTAAPAPMIQEAEKSLAAPSNTSNSGSGSALDYSKTNIQVAGVDEADIIKNDGKYIYLIKGSSIRIVEAYPAENLKEVINFSFAEENSKENFTPSEMYIDKDILTVIGYASHPYDYNQIDTSDGMTTKMAPSYMPIYEQPRVKVYVLNVGDHSKPKIQRSVEFDGTYTSSRKIGPTLYLVMQKSPYITPYYYQTEKREIDIKPADFLPQMLDSKIGKEEFMSPCNKILILPKPRNPNFLITAAVPLNDTTKPVKSSIIVGDAENVYASTKNLYVASTNWQGGFYMPYNQSNNTAIYQFALSENGIAYKNQGKVPGQILNQFSMDENNDYFRIATTTNKNGDNSSNHLFILNNLMKPVGKIENIAPGESIFSVRFLGNRAYMVTFKQIDPLFVIDTSVPTNPKILGKLKIPGYSNYLHPYDENHLMGFGKEVDESIDADKVHSENAVYYTAVQGMKIGMFDVTDVNHPKEMFKTVIGTYGTESELLNNHKALLFDKEKGLLAFPVSVNEIQKVEPQCSTQTYSTCSLPCQKVCVSTSCTYDNGIKVCKPDCEGQNSCVAPATTSDSKPVFVGAYVYHVDLKEGFTLKGKITHLSDEDVKKLIESGYLMDYQKAISRIIYMGNTLYTVSQAAIKANDLSTVSEKNALTLTANPNENSFGLPGIPRPMMDLN